ncbi:unnamed protein product [Prorocentrum cordatum]|uniref:Uncharacterized protein n=1 Tax=Prorocentrum cordatum TaxID=2364126 RepID=A0ABN9RWN7_9DINO|nr:unnamed protein product [Polarella glacialis]
MFGRCSEQCEVLEPCECQESWQSEEDPGCAELQLGCPAVPCDAIADPGSYEPWCKVKNPGCATEEFKGWSYCSGLLELGGGGGVPWLGPLRQSEGQGCAGGLRGEAGYRGNLATTLEQCKALCAAEDRRNQPPTFYTSVAGCEEEACLVGLQPTRCRLSESCELAPAGDLLAVVFQKQAAASDWEGTPSARFRKGFLLGALTIGLMAVCLMCGPCFKLERQSARGDLIFNNGRTILEGADTDDRTDPI